jgi:hypothetical protein
MEKGMKFAVILMGLLFLQQTTAMSQVTDVTKGDKIRVTYFDGNKITRIKGQLQNVDSDSLRLIKEDSTLPLPLSSIKRVEVSTGQRTWGGRGAAIGAISGGVLFGMVAMSSDESCGPDDPWCIDLFSTGESFLAGFAIGAAGGALTGLIIGGLTESDRWEKVSLELAFDPITLHTVNNSNNYALKFRWSF